MAEGQSNRCAFAATYLLIIGFGIGSWLAINGLWSELPLLTQLTPEGPYLQSIINYTIQLANIGPLTYLLLDLVCLNVAKKKLNRDSFLVFAICIVIIIGVVASVSLALTYNVTTVIGGEQHSVALVALTFMLALVDCTSTVTFIPYMERFNSLKFVTALYIGEGLSGMLPSLFALAQGVGVPHANGNSSSTGNVTKDLFAAPSNSTSLSQVNFSPNVYFFLLAGLLLVCGFSFGMLQVLPQANHFKKTRNDPVEPPQPARKDSIESDEEIMGESASAQSSDTDPLVFGVTDQPPSLTLSKKCARVLCFQNAHRQIHLFLMQAAINFLANGAISTFSYFAFACYGPQTLLLATNLGLLMSPIASFVAVFLPVLSTVGIIVVFVVSTLLGLLLLLFGILGFTFHLPLLGSVGGSVLVVSLSRNLCGQCHHCQLQERVVLCTCMLRSFLLPGDPYINTALCVKHGECVYYACVHVYPAEARYRVAQGSSILVASSSWSDLCVWLANALLLQILLSIATNACIAYTKVCLTTKIQKQNQGEGESCALKWCGVSIQVGSLLGAFMFFPIVQTSENPAHFPAFCKQYQQW